MTYEEGVDAIMAVFLASWGIRKVVYENLPGAPPATDVVWARPTVKFVDGGQGALTGGAGQNMQDSRGFILIQVFAVLGDGNVVGLRAAQELVDSFSDYSGDVWFRRVRLESGPSDGSYQCFHVYANFEFNRVR